MRLGLWFTSAFCLVSVYACSDAFDDCAALRACASGGAGAGAAGAAARNGSAGEAGVGGNESPTGGQGGDSAGAGGASVDRTCTENGALTCQGAAQKLTLICRNKVWQPNTTCNSNQNCDQTTGACATIATVCAAHAPGDAFCDGDAVVECGPDLVSATRTECKGLCRGTTTSATCLPPACSDGKLQAPEECDDGNKKSGDGCSADCKWEVSALAAGDLHTCALSEVGSVKCWGYNGEGELGRGDALNWGDEPKEMGEGLIAVDLGKGRTAKAFAAGHSHTCALLDDDTVKCWGGNRLGQLGLGDSQPRGDTPHELGDALHPVDLGSAGKPAAIAAGGDSTCALFDSGVVRCWGDNTYGQLGVGSTNAVGNEANEMGDALVPVDFGRGRFARAVSMGPTHACALLDDATIKCWGQNAYGQLGLGDASERGAAPGELGAGLNAVSLGARTPLTVAVGRGTFFFMDSLGHGPFTCGVLSDGALGCWGYVKNLGLTGTNIGTSPDQLGDALPQLSLNAGRSVVSLQAGSAHICALLDDKAVECWGNNDEGQVGYDPDESPRALNLGSKRSVIALAAGYSHNCALLDDRSVKCWGLNSSGQLGLGDATSRGLTEGEFGDALPTVDVKF